MNLQVAFLLWPLDRPFEKRDRRSKLYSDSNFHGLRPFAALSFNLR
ncbi:hypothetical protein ABIF63_005165 [Bradyrhizobium japonicum]|uniref:Uncharacterized protein n=1 Tax=Bradyrhizobium japonicum TaxID=375 RepID=A0ABV2RXV8_BRAJP